MAVALGIQWKLFPTFQSPSRGGHLRGPVPGRSRHRIAVGFSPLHEGDTSVAVASTTCRPENATVSVPFTRGTPPWPGAMMGVRYDIVSFSPLHEGDTSVAQLLAHLRKLIARFSPLHEGDTSVAFDSAGPVLEWLRFSPLHEGDTSVAYQITKETFSLTGRFSPLHEGDTSVAAFHQPPDLEAGEFQSPSRGGHLRGRVGDHGA